MSNVYTQIAHTTFQQADGPLTATQWTNAPALGGVTPQVASHLLEPANTASSSGTYWSANPFPLVGTQYAETAVHNLTGDVASNFIILPILFDPNLGTGGFYLQLKPDGLGNIVITTVDNTSATNVGAVFTKPFVVDAVARIEFFQGIVTTIYNGVTLQSIGGQSSHNTDVGVPLLFFESIDAVSNVSMSEFAAGTISAAPNPYSVPDSRVITSITPNSSRNVQGTLVYDVPKVFCLKYWFDNLFTRTQPLPVDSRSLGAPTDSRVAGNKPQNSRTPGTFGPGE